MSPEAYVDLYRTMVRTRAFEESVRRNHIAGKRPEGLLESTVNS